MIRGAPSEARVLALLGEFVATLSREDLERIPPACRPPPVLDAGTIDAVNVEAVRQELLFGGDDATRALLRDLGLVFSAASGRLAQLAIDQQLQGRRTPPTPE